ncbi:zinc-binding dehydrogenase [Nocardia sp. NBC_00565]|uniref:zinc-binding dehydrogenase n=1 Tax=Nocardia sp. NBC_00565 TaxID=2975993 RepID=UPI002E82405B|nr:zinc-binding dehydrogenase [Nocardia sp. NBC_00565]WUC07607.1 zinc-binding dehydrogenase [Nocardia sp. NBC_00565]
MLAAAALATDADDPLRCLHVGAWAPPTVDDDDWTTISVVAAALNHHDLWTLRGAVPAKQRLPIVLGSDAAGIDDDGNEVIVYPVIGDRAAGNGDETLDPDRSVLSEVFDGTLAERLAVPRRNLVPKPPSMSFEEAACLPSAWLTAYRMLFERVSLASGDIVLVQGAGGGVSTALIVLGSAAGYRMWVTSRTEQRRQAAEKLGAETTFAPGARLPQRVDAVMDTVGAATWSHSMRSVRDGGRIVVSGATSGALPPAELTHVFYRQVSIVGSTLGTRDQLSELSHFCVAHGITPVIDRVLPLTRAHAGFAALAAGSVFGKIVIAVPGTAAEHADRS